MENAYLGGVQQGARYVERGQELRQRSIENQRAERRQTQEEEQDRRRVAIEERAEARAGRRMQIDEAREGRDVLDAEVDRRRKEKAVEDLDYGLKFKKEEMKRYMAADQAWTDYQEAMKTVEWGSPGAPEQYQRITQSYLPKIALHDGVRKQWEAFDNVTQKNAEFQAYTYAKQARVAAQQEASKIAPWLLFDPPKKADGTIDAKAFSDQLKQEKRNQLEESIRLRQSYYGSRTAGRPLPEPAGVKQDRAMLQKVREKMLDLTEKGARDPSNPNASKLVDQYRRLQDEEQRINERIKAGLQLQKQSPGAPEARPDSDDEEETRFRRPAMDPDDPLGLGAGAGAGGGGLDEVEAGIGG